MAAWVRGAWVWATMRIISCIIHAHAFEFGFCFIWWFWTDKGMACWKRAWQKGGRKIPSRRTHSHVCLRCCTERRGLRWLWNHAVLFAHLILDTKDAICWDRNECKLDDRGTGDHSRCSTCISCGWAWHATWGGMAYCIHRHNAHRVCSLVGPALSPCRLLYREAIRLERPLCSQKAWSGRKAKKKNHGLRSLARSLTQDIHVCRSVRSSPRLGVFNLFLVVAVWKGISLYFAPRMLSHLDFFTHDGLLFAFVLECRCLWRRSLVH